MPCVDYRLLRSPKAGGLPDARGPARFRSCERWCLGSTAAVLSLATLFLIPPEFCRLRFFLSMFSAKISLKCNIVTAQETVLAGMSPKDLSYSFQSTNLHKVENAVFSAQITIAFIYMTSCKIRLGHGYIPTPLGLSS